MSAFPGELWLENARVAVQSLWFALFGAALWMTLWSLQRARFDHVARVARWVWSAAMALLIVMWLGGALLEMIRRASSVSGLQLIVALGAFSLLAAGTLSLAREWFGDTPGAPLRADKIALSLLVLTFAGWWFGGLALSQNALWLLHPTGFSSTSSAVLSPRFPAPRTPDAWALLVGGATLFGAARSVRSRDESVRRVANPRLAMWWLMATILFLGLGWSANNPGAAATLAFSSAVFALKIWRARHDCPRLLCAPLALRVVGLIALLFLLAWWANVGSAAWTKNSALAWHETHQNVAWIEMIAALILLAGPLRPRLRPAISGRFPDRALLWGALAGGGFSSLVLGPGGAIFWMFWPLCGLFFDLLTPDNASNDLFDPARNSAPNSIRSAAIAAELRAEELAASQPAP